MGFAIAGVAHVGAAQEAAQECPAPLKPPPSVNLTVEIRGCDYLGALAEATHTSQTADCGVITRAIAGDTASRVHQLRAMMADSLRPIFAHHFGFLAWPSQPAAGGWTATVILNQLHRGAPGTLQVVLRSPAGDSTKSEPLAFEGHAAIAQLLRDPETPTALAATNARWIAKVRTLLEQNDGFNRSRLVSSVFRVVPIAALTPTEAPTIPQAQSVLVRIPVRDIDLRVRSPHRPKFEWHVDKVVHGQPPNDVDDEGLFELGDCRGRERYQCRLLRLRHGAAWYEGSQIVQFFNATAQLHAPIALHVVEYRPAANGCGLLGENAQ